MFKHLWVERGMLSGLTKKTCILVIVNTNTEFHAGWWHSAGYVCWISWRRQAREAKWRRLEATVPATMPVQFGNIWTHCTAKNVITVLDYRIISIFVKQ